MDEPIRYFVNEGSGETVVHPLALAILFLSGILFLTLPRRYALWPYIAMVCFVSARQCVAFGSLNLYFTRVFYIVLLPVRILIRGENRDLRLNALDWSVIAYAAIYFAAGAINWGLDPVEMKTRSGYVVDIIGSYLIFRILIRDLGDARSVMRCLAIVSLPLLMFFLIEFSTGRNLFSAFGGVPEITAVREGRLRCQGAFGHPILAGTFWASFIPLSIYGITKMSQQRLLMGAAVCSASGIVFLCASSTPILGMACVVGGVCFYPYRRYTRLAFGSLAVLLFCLHFAMKAPVWALIGRINLTSGNSGYHRYEILDGFIRHWEEWWLVGSKVGTAHWGWFTFDTANEFVVVGVGGGLCALVAFIAAITLAFLGAGRIGRRLPVLGWMLGVSVAVQCVCFFGIGIWGQLHVAWALPLAMIGSLAYPVARPNRVSTTRSPRRPRQEMLLPAPSSSISDRVGTC